MDRMPDAMTSTPDRATALQRLREWHITAMGLHPGGSNYVFVVKLEPSPASDEDQEPVLLQDEGDGESMLAIYKPQAGERPLHDFPYGTLHNREIASYLLSEALGWPLIPPTVVREGPHGVGSVQLFIDADPQANFFTMRDDCLELFAPVAMFDVLVHNADRKGGAILKSADGRLWSIDHGLTFNPRARRRTVMFEFNGEPYPRPLMDSLQRLKPQLREGTQLGDALCELLDGHELASLDNRVDRMLNDGKFPVLDPNLNVPWPYL